MVPLRIKNEILLSVLMLSFLFHAIVLRAKELEHRYTSWNETSDLSSCQQKLETLSRRFELFLGVKVIQKRCDDLVEGSFSAEKQKMRSMSLIYRAVNPVSLSSVRFGKDSSEMTPGTFIGAFPHLKQCQEAASFLGNQFSRETQGLVVDSYCLSGKSPFGENRGGYVLHIFGAPNPRKTLKHFYGFGIRPFSSFGKIPQEIEADVVARIEKQGGTIAKVSKGFVWYYASEPAAIKIWPVTGLENEALCRHQKESVLRALARVERDSVSSFYCLNESKLSTSFRGGLAIWSGRRSADLEMTPLETYTSSDACLDDLGRLQRNWLGKNSPNDLFKENVGIVCVAATELPKVNEIYEAKAIEVWR